MTIEDLCSGCGVTHAQLNAEGRALYACDICGADLCSSCCRQDTPDESRVECPEHGTGGTDGR